jgi:hypothetical protein
MIYGADGRYSLTEKFLAHAAAAFIDSPTPFCSRKIPSSTATDGLAGVL